MTNRIISYSAFFITILMLSTSCHQVNFADYEDLVKRSDNAIKSYDEKSIKVFVETSSNEYELIKDLSKWDKEYLSTLNVYENGSEKIVKKIIESDSEDYNCIATFYFYEKGNLMVLIVEASYFNGVCVEGILNKTTRIYFDGEKELYKEIAYKDENGESIEDTEKCVDNFNCDFENYYHFKNIPLQSVR